MVTACFCGLEFESDGSLAACPRCGTPATLPRVTTRDADQMRLDIEAMTNPPKEDPCNPQSPV